jgi:tRNA threonylcarbamoyladenosine biosynthesis protein TsaB
MPRILHIETATESCSAAISDGPDLLALRESHVHRSHAALLTVFIEELFREVRLKPGALDAIAVSKGPGSYTGLRIGVSTAKGLAYGSGLPLIAVNTLESMARGVDDLTADQPELAGPDALRCPMIDARRMEVYRMILDARYKIIEPTRAEIIQKDSFNQLLVEKKILFFGSGALKCREVIKHPNAIFLSKFQNSARHMISLALETFDSKKFENSAYFEPYYLKDFVATIPRNKLQ